MTTQALREFINRHNASAAALAALGAALDARVSGVPLAPALQASIDDLLAALGAGDALKDTSPKELQPLLAELRFMSLVESKLLFHETRSSTWAHTESEILQSAGDISSGFAHALANVVAPMLDGLSARLLAPGGAFLDVGVGVASMSITLAQLLPSLRVVGIDRWAPSLAIAREHVRNAGLDKRIELREQSAEDLTDSEAFDLAWIPTPFVPERVIAAACESVLRTLRPGGWLLFPMHNPGADPVTGALARMRTALNGGTMLSTGQSEALLSRAGFVEVKTLPGPPGAIIAIVVGRRRPA
jgi:SAM-dependent methyltransferase